MTHTNGAKNGGGYRVHLSPTSCHRGHSWFRQMGYVLCSKCGASFRADVLQT